MDYKKLKVRDNELLAINKKIIRSEIYLPDDYIIR